MAIEEPKSSNELAQARTELAVDRTLMAASRTLMAWVRTGLSMIGFGFTIYKFLSSVKLQGLSPNSPRNVGLFLIALGTVSIMFGCIEYWQTAGDLRRNYRGRFRKYPLFTAFFVCGLGIALLVEAFLNSP